MPVVFTALWFFPVENKVLPKVSPYAIYEVPAEDGVSKPLRVAIIGGIDSDAIDKVYPGRFGTIAVNSFCSIVQALEKAYNQNARQKRRAFFFVDGEYII